MKGAKYLRPGQRPRFHPTKNQKPCRGETIIPMPKKIRDLLKDLRKAGFELDRQKGSHRQFKHPNLPGVITLAGAEGADAKT